MASQSAGTCTKTNFPGLLMTTFALPERPRSRRAKYPKVRTGCISCKKRHVKCDEAKPSCNRCLKWSGVCSGYAPPRAKSPAPQEQPKDKKKASARPLMMRTDSTSSHLTIPMPTLDERLSSCSPSPSTPPTPPLLNFPYQSNMNNMGSLIDQYDPIPTGSGILDAAFWTDTVPRLVRDNLAVRYANMAVHLLILSKQSDVHPQVSEQFSQALGYYGLAIRKMRDSYESNGGLRAAILCSMFFIIFEAINGDREAAEAHLFSGQSMLNDLFALLPQASVMGASAGSLRKELKNLLQYLSLQMRIGGVSCWKGEMDSFYSGYLEEYLNSLSCQDDLLGVCDPNLFLPDMGFQDDFLQC